MIAVRSRVQVGGRAFRRVLVARTVSNFGSVVAPIAMAFGVLDLTGSPRDVGLVVGSRSVAMLCCLLIAGAIADRLRPASVLLVSTVVCALSQGMAAGLLITGAPVWQLAVTEALSGAAFSFGPPAQRRLVRQLVPPDQIQRATAMLTIGFRAPQFIASAVGGAMVAWLGPGLCIAFDAASFAMAAVILATVRSDAIAPDRGVNIIADLRAAWTVFATTRWLWLTSLASAVSSLVMAGVWTSLGPVIADAGIGRAGWGLVVAANVIGILTGSGAMLLLRPSRPLAAGALASTGVPVFCVLLAIGGSTAVLAVGALLAGAGIGVFSVVYDTALQTHVPAEMTSRVYAYSILATYLAIPIGETAGGFLAQSLSAETVVLAGAGISVAVSAAAIATADVRRLGQATPVRKGL
jgi:predicted MFS family arabinose efflux permease